LFARAIREGRRIRHRERPTALVFRTCWPCHQSSFSKSIGSCAAEIALPRSKLVDLITHLERRGVEFVSLNESINTSSSGGVLIFHMMAALAEFERNLISERTRAGLAAARARGSKLGRRRALSPTQRSQALELLRVQSASEVANQFNVHPRTMLRLKAAGA
jgi:DNA invertase Pin-like site-specific DNA recombinase